MVPLRLVAFLLLFHVAGAFLVPASEVSTRGIHIVKEQQKPLSFLSDDSSTSSPPTSLLAKKEDEQDEPVGFFSKPGNLILFPFTTFNSTVKNWLFLLYPNKSGIPKRLIFSILFQEIDGIFFFNF